MSNPHQTTDITMEDTEQSEIKIVCDDRIFTLRLATARQASLYFKAIIDERKGKVGWISLGTTIPPITFARVKAYIESGDYTTLEPALPDEDAMPKQPSDYDNNIHGRDINVHINVLRAAELLEIQDLVNVAAARFQAELKECDANAFVDVAEDVYVTTVDVWAVKAPSPRLAVPTLRFATDHIEELMKLGKFWTKLTKDQLWQLFAADLVRAMADVIKNLKV